MFGFDDWRPGGRVPRVISLTRVSTDAQKDNTSHDVQRDYNERWCQMQRWDLVLHLEETISGALYLAREQTQLALEMLERDEADALLLFDMSRYGRDVEYQHKILKRIIKAGKRLYIATLPLEYDQRTGELTPESQDIFNNAGGSSASERARIKRRMHSGREKKLAQGLMPSRTLSPFGYHIVKKADVIRQEYPPEMEGKFAVVEDRAQWVPMIYEMYDRGVSLRRICATLQEMGVKTSKGNRAWYPSTLLDLIKNPVYYGRPAFGRSVVKIDDERRHRGLSERYTVAADQATWRYLEAPALISEELWQRCQERAESARAMHSGRRDRKYFLTGLIRCPYCGNRLSSMRSKTTENGKRTKALMFYRCSGKVSNRNATEEVCSLRNLSTTVADALVVEAICWLVRHPEIAGTARSAARRNAADKKRLGPPGGRERITAELAQLERRERAVAESRIEAKMVGSSVEVFDKILLEVQRRREELTLQQAAVPSPEDTGGEAIKQICATAEAIAAALQSDELQWVEKRELLCQIVEKIECTFPLLAPEAAKIQTRYRAAIARAQHLRIHLKAQVPIAIDCDGTKEQDRFRLMVGSSCP